MGRTLPSITQAFLHEQQSLSKYRRALRKEDQRILDELFAASRQHLAAAAYASHLLPFEIMLLGMLVEQRKQIRLLQARLESLEADPPARRGLTGRPALAGERALPHPGDHQSPSDLEPGK
jgi:hypothetical protein